MLNRSIAGLALLALPAAPALANDSSAAIGIGGLELTRNDAISMDSEDLFLSTEEVRVRYRFTNRSARDVETLVSFPVPHLPGGIDGYLGDRSLPDFREDLKFRTTVDGQPVQLNYVEKLEIAGRDVTARIAQLGWPRLWSPIDYDDNLAFIEKLSPKERDAYIREGLLRRQDEVVVPAWNLVTHVTRRQVFPAGKTIEVTHSYVPLAGGSVGGALDPEYRRETSVDYTRRYCTNRSFYAGIDRRLGTKPPGERPGYSERWLSYILRSGANWRGPIGDFRLVVDKGKPDSLVSFCMDGVKKISPTRFEVRKANFEPSKDIDVLIVEWASTE